MTIKPIPYPWNEMAGDNAQGADAISGTAPASTIDDILRKVVARTKTGFVVTEENLNTLQKQVDDLPDHKSLEHQTLTLTLTSAVAEGSFVSPTGDSMAGVDIDIPPLGYASAAGISGDEVEITTRGFVNHGLSGLDQGSLIYVTVSNSQWVAVETPDTGDYLVGVAVSETVAWLDFSVVPALVLASTAEVTAGTDTSKPITPAALAPELRRVEGRITANENTGSALTSRVATNEASISGALAGLAAINGLLSAQSITTGSITVPTGARQCRLRVWGASGGGAVQGSYGGAGGNYTVSGAVAMTVPGGYGGVRDPLSGDVTRLRNYGNLGVGSSVTAPAGALVVYRQGQVGGYGAGYGSNSGTEMAGFEGPYVEHFFAVSEGGTLSFSGGAAGSGAGTLGVDGKRATARVEFYG